MTGPVEPVKRVVAILHRGSDDADADEDRARLASTLLDRACAALCDAFGALDHVGASHAFDVTDYYAREMGAPLRRAIVSCAGLAASEGLAADKLRCIELEHALAQAGQRRVNLDSGYLDLHKLVLASTKPAPHKIHVGHGIHADFVLRYTQGRFHAFEWTFPDFRDGRYDADLLAIRRRLVEERRGLLPA